MKQKIKRLQLGKNGVTKEFLEQTKNAFENSTIVKISILKSACRKKEDAKKIGEQIVEYLGKNFDYKLIGFVLTVMKFRREVRD